MSSTSPRDAYLAWQAEIGTEEVVLVQPWVKPRLAASSVSSASAAASRPQEYADREFEAPDSRPYRSMSGGDKTPETRGPAFASVAAGADFFSSIAEALAKPDAFVKKGAPASAAPAPKPGVSPAPFLPEFKDLEAYWNFLAASCPIWFPGTPVELVRAEGPTHPLLAIVELQPSGGQVLGGYPGEFLDKMMKGIGLDRSHLYLTSVMKSAPAGKAWARKDIARMVPAVMQELALAGAGLVLLLGEPCAQGVLRTGKSLAALAETAEAHGNMTVVATEHPALLMNADESARRAAWNQLKWLRARLPSQNK